MKYKAIVLIAVILAIVFIFTYQPKKEQIESNNTVADISKTVSQPTVSEKNNQQATWYLFYSTT